MTWPEGITVLVGDVRAKLAELPAESVHCCVTSPPYYGLRAYQSEPQVWGGDEGCAHDWETQPHGRRGSRGISGTAGKLHPTLVASGQGPGAGGCGELCACGAWRGELGLEPTPALYIRHMVEVFRGVRRVLRGDGTVWLNMGDCYASAWPCRRRNVIGTGSLENGKREARPERLGPGLKDKDLIMMPHRLAIALQEDGWWVRSDIVWSKANPMPESVRDRPTRSHEYVFLLTKAARYFFDAEAIRELGVCPAGTRGAKGSAERSSEAGVNSRPPEYKTYDGTRNKRSVWQINPRPYPHAHFATFPPALVVPCMAAGTSEKGCCGACGAPWRRVVEKGTAPHEPAHRQPPKRLAMRQAGNVGAGNMGFRASRLSGQEINRWKAEHPDRMLGWQPTCACNAESVPCVVLDPFAGSGTVAQVAREMGRHAVLIELQEAYLPLIAGRLAENGRRAAKAAKRGRGVQLVLGQEEGGG